MPELETGEEFLRVSRGELRQGCARVCDCLARLSVEQIWHRDHAIENSIGNLVLHLSGNVRQWILGGVGGQPDSRDRNWEFATREPLAAATLVERLNRTVGEADAVLASMPPGSLLESRSIQVYDVTVLHAITHVTTHFAGHVGQIIWATKHFTGQDLGYYGYLKQGPRPAKAQP